MNVQFSGNAGGTVVTSLAAHVQPFLWKHPRLKEEPGSEIHAINFTRQSRQCTKNTGEEEGQDGNRLGEDRSTTHCASPEKQADSLLRAGSCTSL